MANVLEQLRHHLAGRYTVDREIATGGMARVYLATELKPRRGVAIKVLEPELGSRILHARFLREVELSAGLTHPHIVPILATGEAGQLLYYVMPYIEGESLRQRLLSQRRLSFGEAVSLALEVADALAYAHSRGVVHRDIKPENILLAGSHAVVADFGVARAIDSAGDQTLTRTGHPIGTPGYMSPEQALGGTVDARSDIYSLGRVLFEALTGELPAGWGFEGRGSLVAALESAALLQNIQPGVVSAVRDVIVRALAPVPDDRFETVDAFARALSGTGAGSSEHQPLVSRPTPHSLARLTRPTLAVRLELQGENRIDSTGGVQTTYDLHGVLRLEPGTLTLEWSGTRKVTQYGEVTSLVQEAVPVSSHVIPVTRLARVVLRGRWWRPRLELWGADRTVLAPLPGGTGERVTLRFARRDWPLAQNLVVSVEAEQADAALLAAERLTLRTRGAPDPGER